MIHPLIQHQRGATLIISLIMLVLITLFAVTGFNLASVNLKIVGNFEQQKAMEAVAQQAIEQVLSSPANFNLTPTATTVTVQGYAVQVSAPKCNYSSPAKGYSIKLGELAPEDTDWEIRAQVGHPLGAQVAIVQGVSLRLLAGNCP